MYELSLFTGAGGGLLGTHLLGWRPVGYVEFNDYCQRVIAARIRDGILPVAPIFSDVRTFISEGYATSYTGMVDVVTGGFPCQPFSLAGKQAGADDPRNMWPATRDIIGTVRPRYCLLENVPGLLTSGYFGTIIRDLAESGYCVRWRILSAAELGAPHQRDRLWVVAHANCRRCTGSDFCQEQQGRTKAFSTSQIRQECEMAYAESHAGKPQQSQRENLRNEFAEHGAQGTVADMADAAGGRRYNVWRVGAQSDASGDRTGDGPWSTEPDVGRVVDGVAARVDRLKSLGNGQVPIVAAAAWHLLTETQ